MCVEGGKKRVVDKISKSVRMILFEFKEEDDDDKERRKGRGGEKEVENVWLCGGKQ